MTWQVAKDDLASAKTTGPLFQNRPNHRPATWAQEQGASPFSGAASVNACRRCGGRGADRPCGWCRADAPCACSRLRAPVCAAQAKRSEAEAEAHNWWGGAVGVGENGAKENGQAPSGANTRAAQHRGRLGRLDVAKSIGGQRTTNAALASAIAKQKRASARSGRLKMGRSQDARLLNQSLGPHP